MTTTTTTTIPSESALASAGLLDPVSLEMAPLISSGVMIDPWLIKEAAVAYAEKELAKRS